jgi:hypothetical protein
MTMAQAKMPHTDGWSTDHSRRNQPANDTFMPVPTRPRRLGRGVLWADRSGLPEPDFDRLRLMRAMERKNRG